MTNENYWAGKNVLITGINGFIGGNLAKLLVEKGANVFGLIRNQSEKSFLYYEGVARKTVNILGDILDKELVSRIISEEEINVVYHLAAQVEVGVGMHNPFLTFETNIRGTYTLLEAIRLNSNSIEAAIFASTDKAYGSYGRDMMPYKEDYPLIPKFPYDTSKACADLIAALIDPTLRGHALGIFLGGLIVLPFIPFFEKYVVKSKHHIAIGDHEDLKSDLKKKHR